MKYERGCICHYPSLFYCKKRKLYIKAENFFFRNLFIILQMFQRPFIIITTYCFIVLLSLFNICSNFFHFFSNTQWKKKLTLFQSHWSNIYSVLQAFLWLFFCLDNVFLANQFPEQAPLCNRIPLTASIFDSKVSNLLFSVR